MGIQQTEVHKKVISAYFTENEIKQILLEYVLKKVDLSSSTSKSEVKLRNSMGSRGTEYSASCTIEVELPDLADHS
ncbi:hypothetical protein [Acinetobacter sp. ANC 3791]|uniref:hypothetical protein n=1 Tax=Acinetobacter sp. ANC 3791 TaxID=2529836 RepID=UPI001038C564|nr:hypothetical protein [Acinetobacter sp. ANC 3791]TCB83340.1 hypothetical protein E0H90_11465 [Acinetobacter sp. ANC 3791]